MAKCKSCLHLDVCNGLYFNLDQVVERDCRYYKPKKNYVEQKNGQWEEYQDEYEICATEFTCSACKVTFSSSELTDKEFFEMMKYCPNCGAKMDGDGNV